MRIRQIDSLLSVGRTSMAARMRRFRSARWQIAQCAIAAGVAWLIAQMVLGHPLPVFAPIAAVVSLGTSYSQRLRRVAEVTIGVALGVLIGELLSSWLGSGAWQISLIVAIAMTVALFMDAGGLFVNQAAVQGVFVVALVGGNGESFTRWSDALVGGGVALVAATIVPAAPLRRPREEAAVVLRKISELLRDSAQVMRTGHSERGLEILADARATDALIRQLKIAADEGMAVVASSPFRVRHKPGIQQMADIVEPLDRAIRSTRVLVRQVAVAAHHQRHIPRSYVELTEYLAEAVDVMVAEMVEDRTGVGARPALLIVGNRTGRVERAEEMNAEMVLVQLRAIIADLLMFTGLSQLKSSDALPPHPR